jgi:fluoride exporter
MSRRSRQGHLVLKLLVIGLGGFVGAIARYWLSGVGQRWCSSSFPAGTLLVNVLGCFFIGVLMSLVVDRPWLSETARMFLVVGLLGSLTTFSTMGYETVELLKDRNVALAAVNILASVALGLGAVIGGRAAARLLFV